MTKHKSHDERREQILTAAKKCFIQSGFAHTRVDDIARQAGLSKGGIYFHFKSKREIFDALLDQEYQELMGLLQEANRQEGSATEKLGHISRMMMQTFSTNTEEHRKFLIVLGEMGIREPDVHEKILKSHDSYVATLTEQIRQGIADGELRDLDPHATALFLKLIIDGIEQGLAIGYDIDMQQIAQVGFDIVLRGLLPTD